MAKIVPFWTSIQILQTLTFQGAPSGGGSGVGGNDSGGTSGVSRATVKDRSVTHFIPLILSKLNHNLIKLVPKINRFKSFNVQFEELHQRQSQWTVPDQELRESLRLAVGEVLVPAYRSFLKRFGYGLPSVFDTFMLHIDPSI